MAMNVEGNWRDLMGLRIPRQAFSVSRSANDLITQEPHQT